MEQKKKHCQPLQLFILLNVGKHLREYITDLDFTSGLSLSCKSPVALFSTLVANLLLNGWILSTTGNFTHRIKGKLIILSRNSNDSGCVFHYFRQLLPVTILRDFDRTIILLCSCLDFFLLCAEQKAEGWRRNLTWLCLGISFNYHKFLTILFHGTCNSNFVSHELWTGQFIFHEM